MTDRQSTHGHDCWGWGPKHYECAVRQVERLAAQLTAAQHQPAEGVTKRELFTIAAMHTLRAGDYAKWEHLAQDAVSLADATGSRK